MKRYECVYIISYYNEFMEKVFNGLFGSMEDLEVLFIFIVLDNKFIFIISYNKIILLRIIERILD